MRTLPFLLAVGLASTLAAQSSHPLHKDRTGLKWVLPFETARANAEANCRLLMIKPVAFGTDRAGGW